MASVSSTSLTQVDTFKIEADGFPSPAEMGWAVDGVDDKQARMNADLNKDKQPAPKAIEDATVHTKG